MQILLINIGGYGFPLAMVATTLQSENWLFQHKELIPSIPQLYNVNKGEVVAQEKLFFPEFQKKRLHAMGKKDKIINIC